MRKLSVLITGPSKIIDLQESILTTNVRPHILLKKAYVLWELINVNKGSTYQFNTEFIKKLPWGYYSFQEIKKILEKNNGVKLTLNITGATCKMTLNSSTTLTLDKSVSALLGFEQTVFLPGSETYSEIIQVNLGLKYLRVTCNIINESLNLENGKKSDVLVNLPLTTTQRLFGSTQAFNDIESRVSIDKGLINQLEFHVTDQNGKPMNNYGSILLELYIM